MHVFETHPLTGQSIKPWGLALWVAEAAQRGVQIVSHQQQDIRLAAGRLGCLRRSNVTEKETRQQRNAECENTESKVSFH